MHVEMAKDWKKLLEPELGKPYMQQLFLDVAADYLLTEAYPEQSLIFNAFNQTAFSNVKVVILGQDPYHGAGQAHGLAFSVPDGVKVPPSLRNIYKEIAVDVGTPAPLWGNLERWTKQGVFLLNSTLTVRAGEAGSHQKLGWEQFTDAVIEILSREKEGLVFMLWGKYAQDKGARIDGNKHLVLTAAHPSPLSAHNGFFGSRHFSQCNEYLLAHGKEKIVW